MSTVRLESKDCSKKNWFTLNRDFKPSESLSTSWEYARPFIHNQIVYYKKETNEIRIFYSDSKKDEAIQTVFNLEQLLCFHHNDHAYIMVLCETEFYVLDPAKPQPLVSKMSIIKKDRTRFAFSPNGHYFACLYQEPNITHLEMFCLSNLDACSLQSSIPLNTIDQKNFGGPGLPGCSLTLTNDKVFICSYSGYTGLINAKASFFGVWDINEKKFDEVLLTKIKKLKTDPLDYLIGAWHHEDFLLIALCRGGCGELRFCGIRGEQCFSNSVVYVGSCALNITRISKTILMIEEYDDRINPTRLMKKLIFDHRTVQCASVPLSLRMSLDTQFCINNEGQHNFYIFDVPKGPHQRNKENNFLFFTRKTREILAEHGFSPPLARLVTSYLSENDMFGHQLCGEFPDLLQEQFRKLYQEQLINVLMGHDKTSPIINLQILTDFKNVLEEYSHENSEVIMEKFLDIHPRADKPTSRISIFNTNELSTFFEEFRKSSISANSRKF